MNTQVEIRANMQVNDSLFRILFHEKNYALSLYNAINGTDYTDEENLTITTVEDALYVSYKNDLSFVFHDILSLYEQQSTVNPNMPLRGLIYFTEVYKAFLGTEKELRERLYSEKLIRIPLPKYYVFYNGRAEKPESWELRLSTAYNNADESMKGDVEVIAHMINVNHGKNIELMERCKVLHDYSEIVARIRRNKECGMTNEDAVDAAMDECIVDGVLEEFLRRERSRVKNVLLYGMTEEEIRETQQSILEKAVAESHVDGIREGIVTGKAEGVDNLIRKKGFTLDEACGIVDMSVDDYYAYKSRMSGTDFVSE